MLKGVTAFFKHLSHYLHNMGQRRLRLQVFGQAINGDVKLHGGADDSLQQRVMEFLRDARALGQSFFKAQVQLSRHLM